MLILFLLAAAITKGNGLENTFLGCYKEIPSNQTRIISNLYNNRVLDLNYANFCTQTCRNKYYWYSMINADRICKCANYLGEVATILDPCEKYCEACDLKPTLVDVYKTGNEAPGPPRNLTIYNITETSAKLKWQEPESFISIRSYEIKALILHTFSTFAPISPEWIYSNNTFQTELITLQSATKYNMTVAAVASNGASTTTYQIMQTKLAAPDNPPPQPKIIRNDGTKITIKMTPVVNNNGPVSSYHIVVANSDDMSSHFEDIRSYDESRKNGDSDYIAAEIKPEDINKEFIVGDGKYYGQYYNAPLDPNTDYAIRLGVVSRLDAVTRVTYNSISRIHNGVLVFDVETSDSPAVIVGLSVAIGLLTFMLIAGIIGFVILKNRIERRRRQFTDNQELTLQGPMIEVENNGYIHEEEHIPINHYSHLKQKVRTIPPSNLKIEPTNLLGVGKFGRVNSGTLQQDNTFIPVAVYSIHDKKLSADDKKVMLKDLDLLIKTGKHNNIINLIGTSETAQIVCVVLEYISMNLKDLLLGSRDNIPGKFSNMTETQALNIALQIAQGMACLEQQKIIHKQLCARSIMVSNGFVPKISAYGLAQYYAHNKIPDYTRWASLETSKGQIPINSKSDVWSFACLLWEICVLGGTPYGTVSNNEIPNKIIQGLRLPQMKYFSDDLYQLMLDCWQIDPDERPSFEQLVGAIDQLKQSDLIPHLSFNLYPGFQYEQFYSDMELAVRPMF